MLEGSTYPSDNRVITQNSVADRKVRSEEERQLEPINRYDLNSGQVLPKISRYGIE